ncbi:hypothetical protein BT63DRAFT_451693 [Microthyrium microscopicum]|uniref:DUF6590 domain-containing protein n=1 Tax=Microthyrium microscopicum TaxID=703497 RepID=A0A6A6UMX6_9PEZI|nr:hypothetical protein BT63DRAFT_451693 [Microthyrium microscopicum]
MSQVFGSGVASHYETAVGYPTSQIPQQDDNEDNEGDDDEDEDEDDDNDEDEDDATVNQMTAQMSGMTIPTAISNSLIHGSQTQQQQALQVVEARLDALSVDSDSSTGQYIPQALVQRLPRNQAVYRTVRRENQKNFFKPGRVFRTLWFEARGQNLNGNQAFTEQDLRQLNLGFAEMRLFIVIKRRKENSLCIPMHTYGGRGCSAKPPAIKAMHSQAFTGSRPPALLNGEASPPLKRPIRIVPSAATDALKPTTRINYGAYHQVQHNIPVCQIGKVHEDFIALVKAYVVEVNAL